MRKLLFFIICVPILAWAENPPKIISIKEYNPQQNYDERICIVDLYGEMECKDAPQKTEKSEEKLKPKKNIEDLKPTDPFIPSNNEGWEGSVQVSGVGSFNGVGLLVEKRSNHWSFGGAAKVNIYATAVSETSSQLEMMGLMSANYYIQPRWYSYSNKKVFDLSMSFQLGYNYISQTTEDSIRKSSPVFGMGAKISYPLSDSLRIQTGVDMYQNFSLKAVGSGGYLGIGFSF